MSGTGPMDRPWAVDTRLDENGERAAATPCRAGASRVHPDGSTSTVGCPCRGWKTRCEERECWLCGQHEPHGACGSSAAACFFQLKARTRIHPGLELCRDRRPSMCVSSEALFRLETCRVTLHLTRGYVFQALHWFLFSCPCGRPRAGACAQAVRSEARRPPTPLSAHKRQARDKPEILVTHHRILAQ